MKRISIRTAVLLPFILIITIIIIFLVISLNYSYHELSRAQADRVLDLMDSKANEKVFSMLENPQSIGQVYATMLSETMIYDKRDFGDIENLVLELTKVIHKQVPQITTMGYGDENGNFVGVRANINDTYTLMLADDSTGHALNIYSGENKSTDILESFENYDPRERPWYIPVKATPEVQWSDIYINMDEINDATISALIPVMYNYKNELAGVVSVDVSLREINSFLKDIAESSTGVIYVIDRNGKIISHSTDDVIYEQKGGQVAFIPALESNNQIISLSSSRIEDLKEEKLASFELDGQKHYMRTSNLNQHGIDWKLVVVVPENSLVGHMKDRFDSTAASFILLAVIGIIIGTILLTMFISVITRISTDLQRAEFTEDEPTLLVSGKIKFTETDELIESFNSLLLRLNANVKELLTAQDRIKQMTEDENARLELLIKQKTKELETAMSELLEKEKMASLGNLVSGISHEINTPLGVAVSAISHLDVTMKEYVEKISNGKVSKRQFDEFIDTLNESIAISLRNLDRAKDLINSFKRISVDQSNSNNQDFKIIDYIRVTINSLFHELKVHNVTVRIEGEEQEIYGNPGGFSQVLTNLIMNSIIHGFENMEAGEILIEVRSTNGNLEVIYMDNGKGIDETVINKIFEPFFTTNRTKGGSGLGLNIVHNIIYGQFNGTIHVQNRIEAGVEFIITIPNVDKSRGL